MFDPFTLYSRMVSSAFDMVETAQRGAETLIASQEVIAKRTTMMRDAARSPLDGNYTELGKMFPEKVEAFGKAGTAMANDWWAFQSSLFAEAQHMGAMVMKGRAPTVGELSALSTRNAAFAMRAFERASALGSTGLRPIHASATANARRLKHVKS